MKPCIGCAKVLPLDSFYRHPQMTDGRLNRCKQCFKAGVRANRRKRVEYYRARARMLSPLKAARGEWREKQRRARARYPERGRVFGVYWRAIRKGLIVRPSQCERCRIACKPDGHHEDYSKPLEVVWLCRLCHTQRHGELLGRR